MRDKSIPNEFDKSIVNLVHRITGYDEEVLFEYIKLNDYKYTIFSNLTIAGIYTENDEMKRVLSDLHYLNRTMKIHKLIKNNSD